MSTNLIVNGDFETNPLNNAGWGTFRSVEGWTATTGLIEIQEGDFGNGNVAGDAIVELDARANSTLEQTVTIASAGTYTLALEHAMRGTNAATNGFEIHLDGALVDTVQPTTPGGFVSYAIDLGLTAGEHTLAFAAIGTSDGAGSLIDAVSLVAAGTTPPPPPPPPPAENQAPTLEAAIADQAATEGDPFAFTLPAGTFADPDADALTLTATLEDGSALPGWLGFDGVGFSGTPAAGDVTTLRVAVTATDPGGLFTSDIFEIDVAAATAPPPPPSGANLIVNGDFETNPLNNAGWGTFRSVEGWTATTGLIEIQEGDFGNGNVAGDAIVELDARANSTLEQTVTIASAGTYTLALEHAMRGTNAATNGFEIHLDGALVDTVQPTTPGGFVSYAIDLGLTAGEHTLAFAAIGTSDGAGSLIDAVSLVAAGTTPPPPPPPPPAENQAPTLEAAIADQAATEGDPFAFTLPAGTFADPDADALTLTATLEDGSALPGWLGFDGVGFSGTPAAGDVTTLRVAVTATDPGGLFTSDIFEIDVAAATAPPPPPSGANLIVNGDFETNPLNNAGWGTFRSVEGWTATTGLIEIQEGDFGNGNVAGDAIVELDARANSTLEQTVTIASAGTYTLALEHAMRGTNAATNGFEIHLDGALVDTVQPTTPGGFVSYAIDLGLTAGEHTLAFAAIGTSDGAGSLIDAVSLVAFDVAIAPQDDLFRFDTTGADTGNVLANDAGVALVVTSALGSAPGTPVAVTSAGGREATVTLAADGTLSLAYSSDFDTLGATETDTLSFGYTAEEFDGDSGSASVTVEINGASELLSFAGSTDAVIVDLVSGTQATAARVLQLGDSITRGLGIDGGYRSRLWDDLVRDGGLWYDAVGNETTNPGQAPHDIDHQGINSITTARVTGQIDGIVAANPTDVALILLGSNDAFRTDNAPDTVPGDLMTILQSLHSANSDVKVFLGEILERRAPETQVDIDATNLLLPQLVADAQALGIDVTLVDTSSITTADMYDGVHPTAAGHQKLADLWEAALLADPDFVGLTFNATPSAIAGTPDRIVGSQAGDRFIGDGDGSIFDGDDGADWISPGAGFDILRGGAGGDVFHFSAADDANVIEDFEAGDMLIFDGAPIAASLTQSGADVTITYGATTVTVENTLLNEIDYWVNDSFFS